MPSPNPDYYSLIGVSRDASTADIRWAYERALNRANRDGAQRLMTELSQAYDTLSDERRRRTYDRHGVPAIRERSPGAAPLPPPWRIARDRDSGWVRHDIVPVAPRRRRSWRMPTAAVFSLGIVAGLVLALQLTGSFSQDATPAPTERQVECAATPAGAAYSYWASMAQSVTCTNGAAARVTGTR